MSYRLPVEARRVVDKLMDGSVDNLMDNLVPR